MIIGGSTFTNGLVVDTRVYTPISEIAPAMAADSGANQMQHMAVVKDFLLPPPAAPAALSLISSEWGLDADPSWMRLTFTSTPGAPYEIQASGTLAPGEWQPLGQITAAAASTLVKVFSSGAAAGSGEFPDSLLGTGNRRFYRVVRK